MDSKDRGHIEEYIKNIINPAIAATESLGLFEEKYQVYVRKQETASTYYDEKLQKHIIFLPQDLTQFMNTETFRDQVLFVRYLLIHEAGHALFSSNTEDISFSDVVATLKKEDVDFRLFNLFLDIKDENLLRERITEELGLPKTFYLEGDTYFSEEEESLDMSPIAILYVFMNGEQRRTPRANPMLVDEIRMYVEDAKKAKNLTELIKICVRWKDRFYDVRQNRNQDQNQQQEQQQNQKNQQQQQQQQQGGGSQKNGVPQKNSDKLKAELDKLEESIEKNFEEQVGGEKSKKSGEGEDNSPSNGNGEKCSSAQTMHLNGHKPELGEDGEELSLEEVKNSKDAVLAYCADTILPHNQSTAPYRPSTKENTLTIEEATNDPDKFNYKKNDPQLQNIYDKDAAVKIKKDLDKRSSSGKGVELKTKGKKTKKSKLYKIKTDKKAKVFKKKKEVATESELKEVYIVDNSGSMGGKPIEAVRNALLGLNRYAQNNKKSDVFVIVSNTNHRTAKYHTVRFPINEKDIIGLTASGGSDISNAIKSCASVIKNSDMICVMSDGDLFNGDGHKKVIKDMGDKHTLKVALYVGDESSFNRRFLNKDVFHHVVHGDDVVKSMKELIDVVEYVAKKKIHNKSQEINLRNYKSNKKTETLSKLSR